MALNQRLLKKFLYWIKERERIRLARVSGVSPPWTTDKILQEYRFCNVRRADDRITLYIVDWVERMAYKPRANSFYKAKDQDEVLRSKLILCAVARWFNEPKTLDAIAPFIAYRPVDAWDWKGLREELNKRARRGEKIFNAAYIITGAVVPKGRSMSKLNAVIIHVLMPFAARFSVDRWHRLAYKDGLPHLELSWEYVRTFHGMGSFMAGQIVADWRLVVDADWADEDTWAPLGPGSTRGLTILYGEKPSQKEAVEWMQVLAAEVEEKFQLGLCLHDIQNCLCEFSKYHRGYGKQKFKLQEAR